MNRSFWWGVVAGVAGTYAYHRFVGMPGGKKTG